MSIDRMKRVNELVKREVSTVILTSIDNDVVDGVNITKVETSKDLMYAKVFFTLVDPQKAVGKVLTALKKYSPFIRGELGRVVNLKRTPFLSFHQDRGEVYKRYLEDIFTELDIARQENGEDKYDEDDYYEENNKEEKGEE